MSILPCFVTLALCLLQGPGFSGAYHKKVPHHRIYTVKKRADVNVELTEQEEAGPRPAIMFKEWSMGEESVGLQYESVGLLCEAGGVPSPTFHWLKDGKRIKQRDCSSGGDEDADYEGRGGSRVGTLGLSQTKSIFYIDCLDPSDQGNYTCVAQTPTLRKSLSTILTVERQEAPSLKTLARCASKGEPARIYMSSESRLEYEGNTVQFFCRASGKPKPTITWLDRDNITIVDGGNYKLADNGDLVISDIDWMSHMGVYRCEATNKYGMDHADPFLYPTGRGDGGFPI